MLALNVSCSQVMDMTENELEPVAYLGGGAVVRPPPPFGVVYVGGNPGPPPSAVIRGAVGGVWLGF
jgi:hypothetical protein